MAMVIRVPTRKITKTPATTSSLVFFTLEGVLAGTIPSAVMIALAGVGMAVCCCSWVIR